MASAPSKRARDASSLRKPRIVVRRPPFAEDACAVCCSSGRALADLSSLTRFPGSGTTTLVDKLDAWQLHQSREDVDRSVRVILQMDEPRNPLESFRVCGRCEKLLTEIDRHESEFLRSLRTFWEVLDASELGQAATKSVEGRHLCGADVEIKQEFDPESDPGLEIRTVPAPRPVPATRLPSSITKSATTVSTPNVKPTTRQWKNSRILVLPATSGAKTNVNPPSSVRTYSRLRPVVNAAEQPTVPVTSSSQTSSVALVGRTDATAWRKLLPRRGVPRRGATTSDAVSLDGGDGDREETGEAELVQKRFPGLPSFTAFSQMLDETRINKLVDAITNVLGGETWLLPALSKCRLCQEHFSEPKTFLAHLFQCCCSYRGRRPFVCHFCFREFSDVAVFAGHVMYEEMCLAKNDAFKCQHCSESCASPRLLEVHAKEKHPDVEYHELFSCEKCGDEGFASFQSYVLHRRETLPQHAFSVDKDEEVEFRCRRCEADEPGFVARDKDDLSQHCSSAHRTDAAFCCPVCPHATFKSIMCLYNHCVSDFHADRRCRFCEKTICVKPSKEWMARHVTKEHAAEKRSFVVSEKRATRPASNAALSKRGQPGSSVPGEEVKEDGVTAARVENKKKKTADKKEQCPHCGKLFGSSLQRHIEVIHMKIKNFDCQQCDEKFSQKNSLLAHLCAAHGRPYPHECPDCGRKFPHRSSYVVHRASHEKELCPICGKGISGGRAFLRKHIEGFHDRKANIKCDHCEETFLDRSKLYRHEARVHGVRVDRFQFPCPECGKTYTKAKDTAQHCMKKHGIEFSVRASYPCRICGKKFSNFRLIRHMEEHRAKEELVDTNDAQQPGPAGNCETYAVQVVDGQA